MVLTLLQDIVKLMFEMTNASECHRDAVFVCGGDRFVVFDRSAETGVRLAICDSLSLGTVVLLNDLGASALESQNRKPDRGLGFLFSNLESQESHHQA
jgi:hypothetical protein